MPTAMDRVIFEPGLEARIAELLAADDPKTLEGVRVLGRYSHTAGDGAPGVDRPADPARTKRYVLADARFPEHVFKVWVPSGLGHQVQGWWRSPAAREHRIQARAFGRGLAASASLGARESRKGARLIRSIQIQAHLPKEGWRSLADCREHMQDPMVVAKALHHIHRQRFFHADLKPYHAQARGGELEAGHWRWLDLGRSSFWLTPRRRVINLYQAMRFFLGGSEPGPNHRAMCEHYGTLEGIEAWYARALYRAAARMWARKR